MLYKADEHHGIDRVMKYVCSNVCISDKWYTALITKADKNNNAQISKVYVFEAPKVSDTWTYEEKHISLKAFDLLLPIWI